MRVTRRIPVARGLLAKRVEQLDSSNMAVHLAGIYALERTARESPDDHVVIMGMLADYIREKVPWLGERTTRPASTPFPFDIQAILTVLCRRRREFERGRDLHLSLVKTDLRNAYMVSGHLEDFIFAGAHIEGAQMASAHLERAVFSHAHIEGAWMRRAYLQGAVLDDAHLERADLSYADLTGAHFNNTHLEGTILSDVVGLTTEQLQHALIDETTVLPDYLLEPNDEKDANTPNGNPV
jgi:hypothetical protein